MATQKDVAKLANVSFITVSRVINNMGNVKPETREKVKEAIKELNYYPNSIAQGLNKNRVHTLAIETPLPVDQSVEATSYYTRLLAGIESFCIKSHYDILLSSSRGRMEDFDCLKPYYSRKADGVIILGAKPTGEQFIRIDKDNIPCVVIGDRDPTSKVNYVDTKNFEGMYDATKLLIENGHSKIAFITGNVDTQNSIDRYKGYCKAMEENNLSMDKEWLFPGDYTKESGGRAIKTLLNLKNRPTAVVSSTDLMAIGIYEEFKTQGLVVPDDISIIGFDGHELCNYMSPPLSTMRQPLEDMGAEAARILIDQIEDRNINTQHLIFPVEYQQGSSVKKLN
ncbi:MAG: LacI family transcriptional regulator [Spirochaetaceae bacterium]